MDQGHNIGIPQWWGFCNQVCTLSKCLSMVGVTAIPKDQLAAFIRIPFMAPKSPPFIAECGQTFDTPIFFCRCLRTPFHLKTFLKSLPPGTSGSCRMRPLTHCAKSSLTLELLEIVHLWFCHICDLLISMLKAATEGANQPYKNPSLKKKHDILNFLKDLIRSLLETTFGISNPDINWASQSSNELT